MRKKLKADVNALNRTAIQKLEYYGQIDYSSKKSPGFLKVWFIALFGRSLSYFHLEDEVKEKNYKTNWVAAKTYLNAFTSARTNRNSDNHFRSYEYHMYPALALILSTIIVAILWIALFASGIWQAGLVFLVIDFIIVSVFTFLSWKAKDWFFYGFTDHYLEGHYNDIYAKNSERDKTERY